MLKQNIKDQIMSHLSKLLKDNHLDDMGENIKAIIMAVLNKLDIVTREEFDTQQKVLLATRKKLEDLEKIIKKISPK